MIKHYINNNEAETLHHIRDVMYIQYKT